MYDAGFRSELCGLQRASGELRVRLERRDGATVLDRLFQTGCLKARFPRGSERGWLDVVTLNISGGIAGGDQLIGAFEIAADARATIASQAAERYYRAPAGGPAARVRMRLSVGDGAAAEWLPQETILFDGCAIDRRLNVELSDSSWFVGVEGLVFGRAAMGERVRTGQIHDVIRVRRAGRLIWHDAVRMDGDMDALLRRPAVANGARAVANLIHVAPEAERRVDAVRAALADLPAESGVSGWDGMLVARLLAAGAAPLRQAVIAALGAVRSERNLPRVWLC
ncbi:MAG: urease accessory protein UreD [Alphaproteobacteria bacterium]